MIIAIDAGHGMQTAGKRPPDGSMREWQFNSAVAKELQILLEYLNGVTCVRVDDVTGEDDIPLEQRVLEAKKKKASIYISIHANAAGTGWSDANGIETFISERELQAKNKTYDLAVAVQKNMIASTSRRDRGVKGDGAGLYVLRHNQIPAILVEAGFMTNRSEVELLKSSSYQYAIAVSIFKGVKEVFALKEKNSIISEDKDPPIEQWKIDAQKWAKDIGITDGTNPDGALTRVQLWATLKRFAEKKC